MVDIQALLCPILKMAGEGYIMYIAIALVGISSIVGQSPQVIHDLSNKITLHKKGNSQHTELDFKLRGYGYGGVEEWSVFWSKLKVSLKNRDWTLFYSMCSSNLVLKFNGKIKIITTRQEFEKYIIYLDVNSFYSYLKTQNPYDIDVNENGISTKFGVFWIGNKYNAVSPVALEVETINLNYLPFSSPKPRLVH